jgi:hypothetical protein
MLKKIGGREIVLGALAATAFWAVVFVLTSDASATYEICEPTKEGAKECARYHVIGFAAREIGRGLEAYNGLITAIATIFIAWFTLTLRLSTDKLWEAGTEQLNLARDEFNSVHRPKIRLKHLWLTKDIWDGERIEATAVFVNSGMSTAFIREIGIATHIVRKGKTLPTNPAFADVGKFPLDRYELRSGITVSLGDLNDWKVLTDPQNVEIRQEKARLFFVGYIEYEDARGAVRKTAFCRVLQLPDKANSTDRGRFLKEYDPDYEYED